MDQPTFHERVAAKRWGSYISEREFAAIRVAHELAKSPGTVLDIGCEGGRWSAKMVDLGWSPICIDVDPEAIAVCAERLPQASCVCLDKDYDRLPCDDASIDLVLCIEVPPALYADWFLPECRRVLKPGGLAVTVFWNQGSLRGRFASARARRRGAYNYYPHRYVDWTRRVEEAGFATEWAEGFCWAPFPRASDSVLVGPLVWLERVSGLRSVVRYAPWIVSVLRRQP